MREVRWVIVAAMAVLLWWSTPATALECPDGMALVPAGETVVDYQGQMWGGEVSETVWVDEFCIDIYEASQPDATAESFGSWIRGQPIPGATSRPGVLPWVLISWNEAKVACAHAGKRLPTLAEWQTAFSGYGGADWPWGSDEYDETQAAGCYINYSYCDQFPTGGCCYENCAGDQCFTTCDMVGNVSEWVDGYWDEECYGESQVLIAGGAAGGGPYGWGATNFPQAAPVIQLGCWWFVANAVSACIITTRISSGCLTTASAAPVRPTTTPPTTTRSMMTRRTTTASTTTPPTTTASTTTPPTTIRRMTTPSMMTRQMTTAPTTIWTTMLPTTTAGMTMPPTTTAPTTTAIRRPTATTMTIKGAAADPLH